MKIIQQKDGAFVLRLSKGEAFKKTLTVFLQERDIKGAFFYGIGGALHARLGYYHLDTKAYEIKEFASPHLEIVNLAGNVAEVVNEVKIHAHVTLADETFTVFGGHLDELTVGGTLEMFLTVLNPMTRNMDEETGLALLS